MMVKGKVASLWRERAFQATETAWTPSGSLFIVVSQKPSLWRTKKHEHAPLLLFDFFSLGDPMAFPFTFPFAITTSATPFCCAIVAAAIQEFDKIIVVSKSS